MGGELSFRENKAGREEVAFHASGSVPGEGNKPWDQS